MTAIWAEGPGTYEIVPCHALDLMSDVPPIDLLVTDPPYAFGAQGITEWAVSATVATALRESAHKLKRGGWAVVFAASSWRSTAYMIEAVRGVLEPVRFGTWCKPVARSKVRTPGWAWASVNVIVMRKPGKGAQPGEPVPDLDYIVEPPVIQGRRAQLPPAVATWAVRPFARLGGFAFDPFAGAGTLLEAAAAAGMTGLGFEIEEAFPAAPVARWGDEVTPDGRIILTRPSPSHLDDTGCRQCGRGPRDAVHLLPKSYVPEAYWCSLCMGPYPQQVLTQ